MKSIYSLPKVLRQGLTIYFEASLIEGRECFNIMIRKYAYRRIGQGMVKGKETRIPFVGTVEEIQNKIKKEIYTKHGIRLKVKLNEGQIKAFFKKAKKRLREIECC